MEAPYPRVCGLLSYGSQARSSSLPPISKTVCLASPTKGEREMADIAVMARGCVRIVALVNRCTRSSCDVAPTNGWPREAEINNSSVCDEKLEGVVRRCLIAWKRVRVNISRCCGGGVARKGCWGAGILFQWCERGEFCSIVRCQEVQQAHRTSMCEHSKVEEVKHCVVQCG